MFKEWLKADIEQAVKKSDRVVISDPTRFLTFAVRDLSGYTVLTLNSPADEMNARLQAQTSHAGKKVIFLCFFPSSRITQLVEFSGIGGFLNMDNPDRYIRNKLYEVFHQNVALPEAKLLLSAMLSDGKPLSWWRGIANETIEPLDLKEHLHLLIKNPEEYRRSHDDRIFDVLRDEIFKIIGTPTIPVDAPVLIRSLTDALFGGMMENNISGQQREIYNWWANTNDLIPILRDAAANWNISANASPLKADPTHPFERLDRQLILEISKRLRQNSAIADLTEYVRRRIESSDVSSLTPDWLKDLLVLLDFDSSDMYLHSTMKKLTEYYVKSFSKLDTALRHLYDHWLAEPEILRPLQELYEQHNQAFSGAWFAVAPANYSPTQLGIIESALNSSSKTAILVCDGLRLEIAETIASALSQHDEIKRQTEYAKLPSVTENGMSALFGIDKAVESTSQRFSKLRERVPEAEIIQYLNLGSSGTAKKLVVLFGDIDKVGESKGLAGLRDISNYELEIAEAIKRLHRLGYNDIFITADHGFVITGLLDEASKVAPPPRVDVKERFFLTDEYISDPKFIRREDSFPGGKYQYYAKTDKPFRTRGAYGYSHGGFTAQECLIPVYRFSSKCKQSVIEVKIANKDSLAGVSGQFFTVCLKGNDASIGQRVRVIQYNKGMEESTIIVKLDNNGEASAELELSADDMSIILQDTQTGNQLDNAAVRKVLSRDLDDLF